jgi:hypothetical protein
VKAHVSDKSSLVRTHKAAHVALQPWAGVNFLRWLLSAMEGGVTSNVYITWTQGKILRERTYFEYKRL